MNTRSAAIVVALFCLFLFAAAPVSSEYSDAGFHAGSADLTPSERAGREIWYKATAGNDRFHTYVFQQRMGVLIDWWRVLRADKRDQRFKIWGLVNNPGCCTPGSAGCPAKSLDETFGFDWCYGDDELLKFVGRPGYRDPACNFIDAADARRASACRRRPARRSLSSRLWHIDRRDGTAQVSQPAFRCRCVAQSRMVASSAAGTALHAACRTMPTVSDYQAKKLADGSVEPPFLIGMACGACHIAFDPLNPPGRSGESQMGKPDRRDRQPVHAHVRADGLRHERRQPAMAGLFTHPAGRGRYLGGTDRSGQ